MGRKIQLTESQLISVIKLIISEQSEHVKNLYKSWANKRSGNPEESLRLMDDVFKYQNRLSKKDFAQYSSYEELKKDIDKIKQESRSTDATKFYEDGELLVLAANTYEASCKYGAGSKWCTTSRDDDSYWDRHNKTGTEFFWIFKNKPQSDPNHKFSYHTKEGDKTPDWCNAVNNCSKTLPPRSYPKQHPKYEEIINKLQEFHNSRDFEQYKSGFEINTDIVNRGLIVYIKEHYNKNTDKFSKILRGVFNQELKRFLDWNRGTFLVMKVLKIGTAGYKKGTDEIINNKIKNFIENKFKNVDVSKYTEFEGVTDNVIRDLKYVVFRTLRKMDIDVERSILPQLEEKGLTIQKVISKLPDREFEESFIENFESGTSGIFSEMIKEEIYKFIEDNIAEFKKFITY